jgi:NAD(P)-dependent dehydrogenase (short-subunit alcohol dehydrogenase family)
MAVVLVTGSSSGIGLATALHFVQLGHEVYAGVRTPSTATELSAAAERERGLHVVTLDVDDGAAVTRAVGEILDRTHRIDVLVNNAGIGGGGPIADVPVDFAKAMFETNYFGAIRMTQAVLPAMREQRSGAIVNVSSVWGGWPSPGTVTTAQPSTPSRPRARRSRRKSSPSGSAWPSWSRGS